MKKYSFYDHYKAVERCWYDAFHSSQGYEREVFWPMIAYERWLNNRPLMSEFNKEKKS